MTDDVADPLDRNRLDEEESPYLRQHADNPVNWQPWDETALEGARERDQPIFLSVGYSACHWCHVMEEESFADEAVAEVLNEAFVPIKVDREERPDVDRVYQTVCQLVSGRGGWPLSAWLTPEGKPFYVGTYFPREGRQGHPGFLDLVTNIRDSWADPTDRPEMENRADQWTAAATDQLEETPGTGGEAPGEELLVEAAGTVLRAADREHGGFGSGGPKFPQPGRLHVLMRAYDRTGRDTYRDVVTGTLDAMADGGMYDHLGGGFHRYATDREWVVPHFEKMLYDNAELPRAYLAGYQLTDRERYREVAEETLAFVADELSHPDGGFYSTLDAQSEAEDGEREEGVFYVWTPDEVREAVAAHADGDHDPDLLADLFCERYGVTEAGNFEGDTVLTLSASLADLAAGFELGEAEVREALAAAEDAVLAARAERPRPRRDEKVLAGWNGLMVSAFAEAALVCDTDYADRAESALAFVREHLWDDEAGRLSRRFKDLSEPRSEARGTTSHGGDVKGDGYLEDYAFLARGALHTFEATGDHRHLGFALDLAETVVDEFYDEDHETLYFTPASGESLVTRPQELRDQSTPSSVGVACETLLALDHFRPDDRLATVAESVLGTHSDRVDASPVEYPSLVLAADRLNAGSLELTAVADDLPAAWRERLADEYLPDRLLAHRPPTAEGLQTWLDDLGLEEAPPIWANREREGEPTLFVCRSFTCSPPVTDVEEALDWAADLAP